jgi:hypothetical protein
VIDRRSGGFNRADFPLERDCTQVFLTWELPIGHAQVAQALGIEFDTDPSAALWLTDEQVWLNGAPAKVCPETGKWHSVALG